METTTGEEGEDLKIQVASDLHLELPLAIPRFGECLRDHFGVAEAELPVLGHALALLGDIGYPRKEGYAEFLVQQAARFEKVFVVAGNHEFYSGAGINTHYEEVRKDIAEICSRAPNLHFLDKTSMFWRGYRILGCTLWSHIPPEAKAVVTKSQTDFRAIVLADEKEGGKKRKVTTEDISAWHAEELAWLKAELQQAQDRGEKVIVMSHHAPLLRGISNPHHDGGATRFAYGSDLTDILQEPIKAWLFGHTHWSSTQRTNKGIIVSSNQLGYFVKGEHSLGDGTRFDPHHMVHCRADGSVSVQHRHWSERRTRKKE
ncbi:Ser/Thr protein phosphatase superfamily [Balamuthia mandrillaris]